jgi:hypothetical protein
MLTDNDIYFNDEDRAALTEKLNVGDEYVVRGVIVIMKNEEGEVETAKQILTHTLFTDLLLRTTTIECVNDECSIVKFVNHKGDELEQLTTTPELGSMLASNPSYAFGHTTFKKQ